MNYKTEFGPVDRETAERKKSLITQAARNGNALVITPDGITGTRPVAEMAADENLGGLVRFERHYGGCRG